MDTNDSPKESEQGPGASENRVSSSVPAGDKISLSSLTSRARGPRTPAGKLRSKFNATKYGIFSSVILLPHESSAEFDALLDGLRKQYQPTGGLEKTEVDKLATDFWRLRRVIVAENAEIQAGIRFPRMQEGHQSEKQVILRMVFDGEEENDLMQSIADRQVLETCLRLLKDLKLGIESRGFDTNRDSAILTKLYGKWARMNVKKTLFDRYRILLSMATCADEERQKNGFVSPEQCKRNFLEELDEEIRRLEHYRSIESERARLGALPRYVPESSRADYLLRYEAQLERSIDRRLSRLERLQRIRKGQPVPPTLNVNVSS